MTKVEMKQNIHSMVDTIEDVNKLTELQEVISFIANDKVIDWSSLSESEKSGIEEGLKDAEEGRTISYEDLKKKHSGWFEK